MKNLTVINKNGVLCVDSREVAEILRIEHKELLKKIKGGKDISKSLVNSIYLQVIILSQVPIRMKREKQRRISYLQG